VIALLPQSERFSLARQMQNAVQSIGSNIAEGAGRESDAEFERFLDIAAGSTSELQYQLSVAQRLIAGTTSPDLALARRLADEAKAMLFALIRASRGRRA